VVNFLTGLGAGDVSGAVSTDVANVDIETSITFREAERIDDVLIANRHQFDDLVFTSPATDTRYSLLISSSR
jgi:hypothetical protein